MSAEPSFDVTRDDDRRCEVLVVGVSSPGLAGVTAADYLSRHLECEEIAHVRPDGIPGITPFADGRPRNPVRIYDAVDAPLAVLVGELFVPVAATAAFVDSLLAWADDAGVEEVAIPYGVVFPHDPNEHAVFSVATDAFRDRRLAGTDVEGLTGGVLDGVVGELMLRSLNDRSPPTGAFVTPVHPPGPDLEAALLLIDALESVYEFDVDERELRRLSDELHRHYATLADRMEAVEEERASRRDYPVDRSYM